MFKTYASIQRTQSHRVLSKTSGAAESLIIFLLGLISALLAVFLVASTASAVDLTSKAVDPTTSFDTQLNEAQNRIRQYADDQIWMYSVTKQEGSFDTQLNQALSTIRNN